MLRTLPLCAALLCAAGCSGEPRLTAADLAKEYAADPEAADARYRFQPITVSGVVKEIPPGGVGRDTYAVLYDDGTISIAVQLPRASYPSSADLLARVGWPVSLRGYVQRRNPARPGAVIIWNTRPN